MVIGLVCRFVELPNGWHKFRIILELEIVGPEVLTSFVDMSEPLTCDIIPYNAQWYLVMMRES